MSDQPKVRNPDIVETQQQGEPSARIKKEAELVDQIAHEILADLVLWQKENDVHAATMASAVMHVFAHYALALDLPPHVVMISFMANMAAVRQRKSSDKQRSSDAGDVQGGCGDDPPGPRTDPSDRP